MKDASNSREPASGDARPSPGQRLSDQEINRELRSRAMFNPWTVFPLIAVILVAVNFFSGFPFGDGLPGTVVSIIILVISTILIGGYFLWQQVVRHEDEYARELQQRMAQQDQERLAAEWESLARTLETLNAGFRSAESDAGLRALNGLLEEYRLIQPVLDQQRQTDSMAVAHLPGLVEETYREGLNILEDALRLTQVVRSSGPQRLADEVATLEREVDSLRREGQTARAEIRAATIDSHKERIALLGQQQLRVDELLFQSDQCEAALSRTRIELVSLQAGSSEASVSAATESLRVTINRAKEVQAELARLGY